MRYRIEFTKSAERDLGALPAAALKRVDALILPLAENPRPNGATKLSGVDHVYRIRVCDYRIVCEIQDVAIVVTIIRVRHRRDVYR
ncbi:MAG: type II toxin-antitoxin system RelE family toxin [Gemmatimonadaceae bacterium]